jgi:hypothetical protein
LNQPTQLLDSNDHGYTASSNTHTPTYLYNKLQSSPSLEQPTPEETKIGFSTVFIRWNPTVKQLDDSDTLSVLGLVFTFIRNNLPAVPVYPA